MVLVTLPPTLRIQAPKLDAYAWPGGYPIVYLTTRNEALCPACASFARFSGPITGHVHWEGEPIECDNCNADIESAYGPVES